MTPHDATHPDTDVDPLVGVAGAGGGALTAAIALDAASVAVPVIGAVACATAGLGGWSVALSAVAVAIVAGLLFALARTGRTLGARVAGIRIVRRMTGAPAGRHLVPAALTGGLRAYDLRRGRDPIAPALAEFRFPQDAASQREPDRPRRFARPAIIELDTGQRLPLAAALVIGRNPRGDDDAAAYEWPDMSRTLSNSHVRLEWDGQSAWVTDLGSTNGTELRGAGDGGGDAYQPLVPFLRTSLPAEAHLLLGDRALTVTVPA